MIKKDVEGFLNDLFFVVQKSKKTEVDSLHEIFKHSFEFDHSHNDRIYRDILNHIENPVDFNIFDSNYEKEYLVAIKLTVLEYLIQEYALKYFCVESEYEKVLDLIQRKQLNSKLLISVFGRISYVLGEVVNIQKMADILYRDIRTKIQEFRNSLVIETMGPLKEIVDKVASGVKPECYLDFKNTYRGSVPNEELAEYIKEKHGYDLNERDYRTLEYFLRVLSLSLVNDESLWSFGIGGKTIITFANIVAHHNDIKHAEKIIDYAFESACKDSTIKQLYDYKLPFVLATIKEDMIKWCINRLSIHLSKVANFEMTEQESKGLIYPINKGYDKEIEAGKSVFHDFFKKAYKEEYNQMIKIFSDVSTIIQDEKKKTRLVTLQKLSLYDMLEFDLIGYEHSAAKKVFLNVLCNDFNSNESVLDRLYYRLYIMDKYAKELSYECIYEYLYPILNMINIKYNMKCSFVYDNELRNQKYLKLKGILSKYDFDIKDDYKDLYIIALLDRKYATLEEADKFAELEQYGDAIYELAVDNILFYNPDNKYDLNHEDREKLVQADAQVKVSNMLKLNETYISQLNDSLNNKKYYYNEAVDAGLNHYSTGHYLADSLEMVIAVIAKQFGIMKALEFATKVILEANSNLTKPVMYKGFDYIELYNSDADKDYLNKIYPSLFSNDSEYSIEYSIISQALAKILKIYIVGNDTIEKRKMIAREMNQIGKHYLYENYYPLTCCYLHYGLEETLKKYEEIVKSSYSEYLK